jgi:hypothetical protein
MGLGRRAEGRTAHGASLLVVVHLITIISSVLLDALAALAGAALLVVAVPAMAVHRF